MIVDLRSDTVTQPTPAMREAMMAAPLGDDVLGDDPTVQELEKLTASLTGHESGVFIPSGTMGNQIAIASHTNPGDSVLCEDEAHILYYEVGAPAVLNGVTLRTILSEGGVIDPEQLEHRILKSSIHTPGTTLMCFENTHNRAGGTVTSIENHKAYKDIAEQNNIKTHLDGARVFNAAIALNCEVSDITKNVESVSVCLSKGLGAPVGSVLTGRNELIDKARIWRKRLGGGMRQSGLLAAAGIFGLKNIFPLLKDDHRRTHELFEALDGLTGLEPKLPETNILMVSTAKKAEVWKLALEGEGVRTIAMDPHRLRLVFHHQVDDEKLDQTIKSFRKVAVQLS